MTQGLQSEQSGERDYGVKIPIGLNRGCDFPFIHKRCVQGHVPRPWKPSAFFTNLVYDLAAYAGLSLDFHDEHRHAGLYEKVDLLRNGKIITYSDLVEIGDV